MQLQRFSNQEIAARAHTYTLFIPFFASRREHNSNLSRASAGARDGSSHGILNTGGSAGSQDEISARSNSFNFLPSQPGMGISGGGGVMATKLQVCVCVCVWVCTHALLHPYMLQFINGLTTLADMHLACVHAFFFMSNCKFRATAVCGNKSLTSCCIYKLHLNALWRCHKSNRAPAYPLAMQCNYIK